MMRKIFPLLLLSLTAFAEDVPPVHTGPLQIGDMAPDFTLPNNKGESVTLSSFRGQKKVVLYFYPRDNTPGCTKEAEQFRDDLARIEKAGAVVLGVSVDDVNSHKAFAKKLFNKDPDKKKSEHEFALLSDVGGRVSKAYNAMGLIMSKRVTFVINDDGKIVEIFPDVTVTDHSKAVLKALQTIAVNGAMH